MPQASRAEKPLKSVKREFFDTGETLTVEYWPDRWTPRVERAFAENYNNNRPTNAVVEMLCELVESWDLTDDDGVVLPLTVEGLDDVSASVLSFVMVMVQEDMTPDPKRRRR
jgi:hypothetical protein